MAMFALRVAHLPPTLAVLARPHAPAILSVRTARTLFRVNIIWRTYQSNSSPSRRTSAGHCRARHLSRRRLRLHRRSAQSTWGTRAQDQPVHATSSSSKQTDPLRPSAMRRGAVSPRDLPTCSPALRSAPTIVAGATHHRRLRLIAWECSSQSMYR